ncbi:MAG: lipase maturation factor family protein, partial [Bdellovibrionota bacterium]
NVEGTPPPILGEGPGERAVLGDNGSSKSSWPFPLVAPIVGLILLLNLVPLVSAFRTSIRPPGFLLTLYDWQSPFHLVSGYGLFSNMTTERPEIIVEGSNDGKDWKAYEFKWKPGDLKRRPGFVQPHMPRLDWVMWFAALGNPRHDRWFVAFAQKLLQGSPRVLALLDKNPFPEKPPKLLRSTLYDYKFTTFEERKKNGAWWKRTEVGPYTPILYIPESNPNGLAVWEGE